VFVSPAARGQGLGRILTQKALNCLKDLGCTSYLLTATELGRPIYDRLGFSVVGEYVTYSGPRVPAPRPDPRLRRLQDADLQAVLDLDRAVIAEDREHAIRARRTGWVIEQNGLRGFALRSPFGYGPAIAELAEHGRLLLDALRGNADDDTLLITLPAENTRAAQHLEQVGFKQTRRIPRMLLGEPVPWQPEHVWAIFSFAMG
jgi:GNAT superfamily N-acetyltransferase